MAHDRPATVLVVEDDPSSRELYETWLSPTFDVLTATDGETAITLLDDGHQVDVVLLDRRLPGMSGREVLTAIRDRELECRVAMLTGVDPGLDIVDMPFDDYLRKPVSEATLVDLVNQLLDRAEYGRMSQRYFSLTSKLVMLEMTLDSETLAESEEYAALQSEYESIKAELDDVFETAVDSVGYETLFSDLPGISAQDPSAEPAESNSRSA